MESEVINSNSSQVGDYLFNDLIATGVESLLWSASQVSVDRDVIISSLREELLDKEEVRAKFLSNLRIKARVDHPRVGSILEAITDEVKCFYAMDKLHGENLAIIYKNGEGFTPAEAAKVIGSIAQTSVFLESQAIATSPLAMHDIFIVGKVEASLNNMAIDEPVNDHVSHHDKQLIGQIFKNLLIAEQPGSTRMASLLDYMIGIDVDPPLSWQHIAKLAAQVDEELRASQNSEIVDLGTPKKMRSAPKILGLLLGGGILAIIFFWLWRS